MAVTLNDYLKNAPDALSAGVIKNLLRQSKLMQLLPIVKVDALKLTALRWQTLPTAGKRKLNAGYTEGTGQTEEVAETIHMYGGDIKVDRVFTKVKSKYIDELKNQTMMKSQALAAVFNNDFINGDHASDVDAFEGLKKRVANLPSRMTVDLSPGSGAELNILTSAATQNTFLDGLHELVHKVKGGEVGDKGIRGVLLMNETSYLGIGKVLRRLGLLDTTKDAYERTWETFRGLALVDVGVKGDQSTEIITSTEDPGDGGTDSSSIYGVRFGEDDGLHMIELNGTDPNPYDPIAKGEGGVTSQGPAVARRIDWGIGLRVYGSYAVGRLKGFEVAA